MEMEMLNVIVLDNCVLRNVGVIENDTATLLQSVIKILAHTCKKLGVIDKIPETPEEIPDKFDMKEVNDGVILLQEIMINTFKLRKILKGAKAKRKLDHIPFDLSNIDVIIKKVVLNKLYLDYD